MPKFIRAEASQVRSDSWGVIITLPDGATLTLYPQEARDLAAELKNAAAECEARTLIRGGNGCR